MSRQPRDPARAGDAIDQMIRRAVECAARHNRRLVRLRERLFEPADDAAAERDEPEEMPDGAA